MPIRWAIYDPNNAKKALLATEIGVWYTDELDQLSPEWIPVNEGLANVRVDMPKNPRVRSYNIGSYSWAGFCNKH